MKFALTAYLCTLLLVPAALMCPLAAQSSPSAPLFQQKLDRMEANAALPQPSQSPTVLSESEINSYLASGQLELPAGVKSLRLHGEPGVITANSRVDFDELQAGRHSSNPLLSMFSGLHDVVVVAHAHGLGHQGMVHVDSVSLDGVEIPQFALQMFVEKYIQPKYPNLGIDSRFALPDKIDTATVGEGEVTLTQK